MTMRYLLLTLLIGAAIGGCGPMRPGLSAPAQPRLNTKPVLRIEPGMHTATIGAISAAGRVVLTASYDRTARLWDARSGALLQVYRPPIGAGNDGKLYAGALSPDGRWVAVGGWTKGERAYGHWVYLFERATGTLRRRLTGPANVVRFLAFSPDGQRLAATSGSGGLHLWRTDTWAPVFHARDCKTDSYGVAWQAGGEWVTTCHDGVLRRYAADGRLLGSAKTPGGRRPHRVAARDGQIAVGYEDSAQMDLFAADLRHQRRLTTGVTGASNDHSELIGIFDEGSVRTRVLIYFAISMSNHMHLIVSGEDANQMGRWASFCFAQSARAAQFHHRLRGRIWGRRFRAIPILDEAALEKRVAYLMAQACCESADLVEKPSHWVGMNAVDAACRGVEMRGLYLTAELRRQAVREGKSVRQMYGNSRAHRRVLRLAPMPWIDPAPHAQQAWFRRIEKKVGLTTKTGPTLIPKTGPTSAAKKPLYPSFSQSLGAV